MLGWGVKPGGRRVAVAVGEVVLVNVAVGGKVLVNVAVGEGVLVKVAVTVKVAGSVGVGPLPNKLEVTQSG